MEKSILFQKNASNDKNIDEIKKSQYEEIILNIKEQLKEKYMIIVDKIEKNIESTDGNVYIIYSKKEKYVVKVYDNLAHAKSMIDLHIFLISSGINVPKIICSKNDQSYINLFNKNYFVIYSFMEGKQVCWNQHGKIDDFIISDLAKVLRKLHSATAEKNKFQLPELPFTNISDVDRYSVLHFDITKNNIFINRSIYNEIGLIDFDDAKYGPSVCDVAITIANLFFSKTNGADIEGVYKFIDEYYFNEPELKTKELPLVKIFALQWIDYILEGNEFDTSTTESFLIKHKLINEKMTF